MPVPDEILTEMREMKDSALRALLALVRLSFRFDPEQSAWVCPDRAFSRAEVEEQCNLTDSGTRKGLAQLEEKGYVSTDRSGRAHRHTLEVEIPERRYTYVPTDFLDKTASLSGSELRLTLVVLRATWGWTTSTDGGEAPMHRRWEQLSTSALSKLTGRSTSAVKEVAQSLQGRWLQRRRLTSGAYHYRFRTEVLTTETSSEESTSEPEGLRVEKKREAFFSMGIPNDLPPYRQQSGPSHRGRIEIFFERPAQHSASREETKSPRRSNAAMQSGKYSQNPPHRGHGDDPPDEDSIDVTGFSDRKRQLGQILANVGVWPRRIPDLLSRFSAERIEANFQLFRERAPNVRDGGAWLTAAIEGGFALPSPSGPDAGSASCPADSADGRAGATLSDSALPPPGTKVSESRRRDLLEAGLASRADFDRAPADERGVPRYFYRLEPNPSRAAANLHR